MVLASLPDDEILGAPADEQLSARHVAEVAGLSQPSRSASRGRAPDPRSSRPSPKDRARRCGRHGARAAAGRLVHDPHLVSGKRAAAARRCGRRGAVDRRDRHRLADQPAGVDAVDHHAVARQGDGQRMLRQTIARHEARRAEARRRETIGECLQRIGADRFGAAPRDPPARKVERLDLRRLDPPQTQLVGEVRRERDRAAIREIASSHAVGRFRNSTGDMITASAPDVHRGQQHADEAHVVVERQPADADIVGWSTSMPCGPAMAATLACQIGDATA